MTQIVAMFIALADSACCCTGWNGFFPPIRRQPLWRSDSRIDVLYLLFTPVVTRSIAKLVALVGVGLALQAMGQADVQRAADGFGPVVDNRSG